MGRLNTPNGKARGIRKEYLMYDFGIPIYGSNPRTTIDDEWTEEELADNIDDECIKLLDVYRGKYVNKAVYDSNLLKPAYLAEKIKSESEDPIEIYNSEFDKHRNDGIFGIHLFDRWIERQVRRILNSNLVGGIK